MRSDLEMPSDVAKNGDAVDKKPHPNHDSDRTNLLF
jgi:hypothetical protein